MKKWWLWLIFFNLMLGLIPITQGSVTIDPGAPIYFIGGNQNFSVTHQMTFSSITVDTNYIGFNNTFFNISSPSSLWVNLTYLDDDIASLNTGEEALDFNAESDGSTVFFNLSGFTPSATYNISNSSVHLLDCVASAGGVIGFSSAIVSSHFEITMSYGGIYIDVFDENTSLAISSWSVIISNPSGTEIYARSGCSNTLFINASECPQGEDISIQISAANYSSRLYYVNIYPNVFFSLDAYLPYTTTPPPSNITYLYPLTIINEVGQTVSDVLVTIKGLINSTSYETVSSGYTDGNGKISVWLIPSKLYKVILNKSGYDESTNDYIPQPPDDYGVITGAIFKIYSTSPSINESTFYNSIFFNGYIDNSTLILYVNYTDTTDMTLTTDIYVYIYNNSDNTTSLLGTYSGGTSSSYQYNITGIDNTCCYQVVLYLNHTLFGYQKTSFMLCGEQRPGVGITSSARFDLLFGLVFGTSPGGLGWSNIFGFFIILACLFSFGERDCGLSSIICGFVLLFINSVIGLSLMGVAIPILFIVVGSLIEWRVRILLGGG